MDFFIILLQTTIATVIVELLKPMCKFCIANMVYLVNKNDKGNRDSKY